MSGLSLIRRRRNSKFVNKKLWETVFKTIENGTYKSIYSVGDTIPLSVGSEGTVNMQIVAFDRDELANETGYAHITFISLEALKTDYALASSSQYTWAACKLRNTFLRSTVAGKIQSDVMNNIVPVTKYSRVYNTTDEDYETDAQTSDTLWIPSAREIFAGSEYPRETMGPTYADFFNTSESRIKVRNTTGETVVWRLRTWGTTDARSYGVTADGAENRGIVKSAGNGNSVVLGFCM